MGGSTGSRGRTVGRTHLTPSPWQNLKSYYKNERKRKRKGQRHIIKIQRQGQGQWIIISKCNDPLTPPWRWGQFMYLETWNVNDSDSNDDYNESDSNTDDDDDKDCLAIWKPGRILRCSAAARCLHLCCGNFVKL